jgi:hypothetical protein
MTAKSPSHGEVAQRAMALHEAGHQITAVALGGRSKGVTLAGDSGRSFDSFDHLRFQPTERKYWTTLSNEIQVLLAGAGAVQIFYEEIDDDSDAYGSDDDEKALQPLLLELSGNEEISVALLRGRFEALVMNCLATRWEYVKILADRLTRLGTLSADEVAHLLQRMPRL